VSRSWRLIVVLAALSGLVVGLASASAPAASPAHARSGARHIRSAVIHFRRFDTIANPLPPGTGTTANRYSLVHGCFALSSGGQSLAPADAPFTMQATALGQYLIYGRHGDFLGAGAVPAASPGPDTVWQVDGSAQRGYTMTNLGTGGAMAVTFTPASGCAVYPEGMSTPPDSRSAAPPRRRP
jgi:hypothetical protein